jgi:ketosteroid isomerase-like protein
VSEGNVELVKRQIGAEDVVQVVADDRAWAARLAGIESRFAKDFEFIVHAPGERTVGHGFAELRAVFSDWMEPWDSYVPNIEKVLDLGDRVVVLGHDRGWMKGVDGEIDVKGAVIYEFDDGTVKRIEYYLDRSDGLRAAGLS